MFIGWSSICFVHHESHFPEFLRCKTIHHILICSHFGGWYYVLSMFSKEYLTTHTHKGSNRMEKWKHSANDITMLFRTRKENFFISILPIFANMHAKYNHIFGWVSAGPYFIPRILYIAKKKNPRDKRNIIKSYLVYRTNHFHRCKIWMHTSLLHFNNKKNTTITTLLLLVLFL